MSSRYFKSMQNKFNFKFKYLEDTYKGVNSLFKFICPVHGIIETTPNKHRKVGCCKCNKEQRYKDNLKAFVAKANIIHNSKYTYLLNTYTTNRQSMTIICPEHGEFTQTPSNHLKGHGCKKCQYTNLAGKFKKALTIFKAEASRIHHNKYSYDKTTYTNIHTKVYITCPIHGDFIQTASHHLRGCGCPKCNPGGFNQEYPGYLYYLKINNGQCYKIGITNLSVAERYSKKELECIELIDTKYYKNGKDAYKKEQEIIKYYKQYQYLDTKPLNKGNTELFNVDLLKLKENHEITTIGQLKT